MHGAGCQHAGQVAAGACTCSHACSSPAQHSPVEAPCKASHANRPSDAGAQEGAQEASGEHVLHAFSVALHVLCGSLSCLCILHRPCSACATKCAHGLPTLPSTLCSCLRTRAMLSSMTWCAPLYLHALQAVGGLQGALCALCRALTLCMPAAFL